MSLQLVPPVVTEGEALTELRMEVRDFLAEQIADGRFTPHVDTWPTRCGADCLNPVCFVKPDSGGPHLWITHRRETPG